jgi:hypothetical protein
MGFSLVAIALASLLPLQSVVQQALIGVVLLWLGVSFMLGLPHA